MAPVKHQNEERFSFRNRIGKWKLLFHIGINKQNHIQSSLERLASILDDKEN